MTKGELAKGVAIRAITALGFGVLAYFTLMYALEMVGIFGEGLGVDERSRQIYKAAHQIVHIFAAACAFAVGVFLMTGNKVLRRLAIVGVFCAGGYGVFNMIGFTSNNRAAVVAAKESDKAAVEREYLNARKDLQDQIKWLENQVIFSDSRSEKRRMETAVDNKRKELSALKAPRFGADKALSDAQATTLAWLSPVSERTWQFLLPVFLALLVFFTESFSFAVVGHMLVGIVALVVVYRTSEPAQVNQKTHPGSGGSDGSGGGEPRKKPDLKSVPKPEPQPARAGEPSRKQRSVFYVPSTGAPERLSAFDLAHELALQNPHLSTRALVAKAKKQFAMEEPFSQSTASRVKRSLRTKIDTNFRKYGNGRSYQTPAYN